MLVFILATSVKYYQVHSQQVIRPKLDKYYKIINSECSTSSCSIVRSYKFKTST